MLSILRTFFLKNKSFLNWSRKSSHLVERMFSRVISAFRNSEILRCVITHNNAYLVYFHHNFKKNSPRVPNQNQIKLFHVHPNDFFKITYNSIFTSTPRSFEWLLVCKFPHQNHVGGTSLPSTYLSHTAPFSSRNVFAFECT